MINNNTFLQSDNQSQCTKLKGEIPLVIYFLQIIYWLLWDPP